MAVVGVILLSHNGKKITKECVSSLRAQKDPKDTYEIVILDTGSKNPLKDGDIEDCRMYTHEENLGFAAGNNRAVQYLLREKKPEYILLLNSDTRVTKGMVGALILGLEKHPDTAAVVPKIYFEKGFEFHSQSYRQYEKGRVIWYAGGDIDWPNMILSHRQVDEVDRGQVEDHELGFGTGCCLLLRPSTWQKLGGFDEAYFLYYEDADLSMRIQRVLRKSLRLVSSALLYHQNAGSSGGSGSAVHRYYQTRNRIRFGLQYAPFRTKISLLFWMWRTYMHTDPATRLGILDALGGKWGNQHSRIPAVTQ